MRIAFLTSSLEPGRDGVGDYTTLLAQECMKQGHPCCLIALHDRHLSAAIETDTLLRLPTSLPWSERAARAAAFRARFAPDRVSLQFVPYGYDDRGIVRHLARHLGPLAGPHPLHIFFHELWIGANSNAPAKEKIMGAVQRHYVLRMIRALPTLPTLHTSNAAYAGLLAQNGLAAGLLPLFGQIPISPENAGRDNPWLLAALQKAGLEITPRNRDEFWFFGLFGTLHPVWPPEPLLSSLREAGRKHGRKIVLLAIGRMGGGETLWDSLASRYSGELTFCKLGERPPEEISRFLQGLDFGIATTPWAILGKSGTVAAMREHGLPVIVNRDEIHYPFPTEPPLSPLLLKWHPDLMDRLSQIQHQPPRSTLPDIARQFLADLEKASTHPSLAASLRPN